MTKAGVHYERPIRYLSVRVPWHDGGWAGTVCKSPKLNGASLRLARIATERNDDAEQAVNGRAITDIPEEQWPVCVVE